MNNGRILKLQYELQGPQKQVQCHSDFFWHSVYYIMEEKGTTQVQGCTKWLTEGFHDNL